MFATLREKGRGQPIRLASFELVSLQGERKGFGSGA